MTCWLRDSDREQERGDLFVLIECKKTLLVHVTAWNTWTVSAQK